ncbi:MAG: hypothetical protein NC429_01785 [Lachnospiraceae bacterium]|nr:hypothetical protein [Lachnospiraceae bacterium]
MNEDISLNAEQEVVVTIPDMPDKKIDLKKYMGRGKKMFHSDAQEYIRAMRDSDRIYFCVSNFSLPPLSQTHTRSPAVS